MEVKIKCNLVFLISTRRCTNKWRKI